MGNISQKYHQTLANYLLSKPLYLDELNKVKPNIRKLAEQAWQQTKAVMWNELEVTLCNLDFIEAKCTIGMIYDLLGDYKSVIKNNPIPIRTACLNGDQYGILCPFCLAWKPINISGLGQIIHCPECKSKMKINSFTIEREWHSTHGFKTMEQKDDVMEFSASNAVLEFFNFIKTDAHIIASEPTLTFQQAANQPDLSTPAIAAKTKLTKGFQTNPWIQWVNKPQNKNACIMTIKVSGVFPPAVDWSIDGRFFVYSASSHKQGKLKLCDSLTGTEHLMISGHTKPVSVCAWSPAGNQFASASFDEKIKIWNSETGGCVMTLSGNVGQILSFSWSPDAMQIVAIDWSGKIRLWDVLSGKQIANTSSYSGTMCLWSPGGKYIAITSPDNMLRLLDPFTGVNTLIFSGHTDVVNACAWSPDGKNIASTSSDRTLKIWNVESAECILTLRGHKNPVSSCGWSASGHKLASGSTDGELRIWDALTGAQLAILSGGVTGVLSCIWSPDETQLLVSSFDGTIKLFNVAKNLKEDNVAIVDNPLIAEFSSCAWSPDGKKMVSFSGQHLTLWNADNGLRIADLQAIETNPKILSWSPDGKVFASEFFGKINLWDPETCQISAELVTDTGTIRDFAWSPDGSRMAAVTSIHSFQIWDTEKRQLIAKWSAHKDRVNKFLWSPDGAYLFSASFDKTLKLWNSEDGNLITVIKGDCRDCAWSPDGVMILYVSDDHIKVWNALLGECVIEKLTEGYAALACAWSPDGGHFATVAFDGRLYIWGEDGALIKTAETDIVGINHLAWSSDGRRIAISSPFGNILMIWDNNLQESHKFFAQAGFNSMVWAGNGQSITVADKEGWVYLLRLVNFGFDLSICTPTRLHRGRSLERNSTASFRCPACGKWFGVKEDLFAMIEKVVVATKTSSSPVADQAFNDSQRVITCEHCLQKFKVNPVIAGQDLATAAIIPEQVTTLHVTEESPRMQTSLRTAQQNRQVLETMIKSSIIFSKYGDRGSETRWADVFFSTIEGMGIWDKDLAKIITSSVPFIEAPPQMINPIWKRLGELLNNEEKLIFLDMLIRMSGEEIKTMSQFVESVVGLCAIEIGIHWDREKREFSIK